MNIAIPLLGLWALISFVGWIAIGIWMLIGDNELPFTWGWLLVVMLLLPCSLFLAIIWIFSTPISWLWHKLDKPVFRVEQSPDA